MTISDISSMSRYVSPINPAMFPHLTLVLMAIGLFFTAWFFVYEVGYLILYTISAICCLVPGDLYQVLQGDHEGVGYLCSCISLHGLWNFVSASLGWDLCLDMAVDHHSSSLSLIVMFDSHFTNFQNYLNIPLWKKETWQAIHLLPCSLLLQ